MENGYMSLWDHLHELRKRARFKLAMWGGFLLGFPFVLYQILAFVAPGPTKKEKRFFIIVFFFLMILFYGEFISATNMWWGLE